jgi:hypothetical protein
VKAGPSLLGLRRYASRCLKLEEYLQRPGDGRIFPQIPASVLLWGLLASKLLRVQAFSATERLVRSRLPGLGVDGSFSDDALAYFIERLDADRLRGALQGVLWSAKRNKAFQDTTLVGLALDGTGVGHSRKRCCSLCHPHRNGDGGVTGWGHKMVGASVVADALNLPLDVEFYPPGQGELTAGKRLLERVVGWARIGFDYLVVDGLYPGAPFLALADSLGLPVVARLTQGLPELFEAAEARFRGRPPSAVHTLGGEVVELWDADDFEPWWGLKWSSVRVLRYRQHRKKGEVVEAYWLTNFSTKRVGSLALYRIAKSRWQIENGFFNEAKTLYHLDHTAHHQANAVVVDTLLLCLSIGMERLYRLRYLHRGSHRTYTAAALHVLFWLALSRPIPYDTS